MELISVVVPVYNSEKYIRNTLESLSKQTYTELEIIMVDDGSVDSSALICKEFEKKDSRFKYYYISNSGPSVARNKGVSLANGTYIGFCDSDDIVEPDMYECLFSYIKENSSDLVLCDIYSERNNSSFGFTWKDGYVFSKENMIKELAASMIGNISDDDIDVPVWGSVVRGLYRRDIIVENNVSFPTDIHFAEDLVFSLRYIFNAEKAVICSKSLYYYRNNNLSIMNSFYSYKIGMFSSRKKLIEYIFEIISESRFENDLERRMYVTSRCYFHECIGNACRSGNGRNLCNMISELREIVNDSLVKKVFSCYRVTEKKKSVIYGLIKHKQCIILLLYYRLRFLRK